MPVEPEACEQEVDKAFNSLLGRVQKARDAIIGRPESPLVEKFLNPPTVKSNILDFKQ